jgi:hypothetical protein
MIDLPQGVDADALIKPCHNLIICRRRDGGWRMSFGHTNPRKRRKMIHAEGFDFEDALRELEAKLHEPAPPTLLSNIPLSNGR